MALSTAIWNISAVLPLLCAIANAADHGESPELPQNCQDSISLILESCYSDERPAGVNCSSVIRSALNDGASDCPSEQVLQSCFQVVIRRVHCFRCAPLVSYTHYSCLDVHRIKHLREDVLRVHIYLYRIFIVNTVFTVTG